MTEFVLALDGGGSKTDVVALGLDGTVLGTGRGTGSNPQVLGLDTALAVVSTAAREALEPAHSCGDRLVGTHVYLSGLDLPVEIETFRSAITGTDWAGASPVIDNDLFALLRAGTSDRNAVAVVCGTGINAVGVREDGATARFPALGIISGDWGGGSGLGEQALWHAARGSDGRGAHTALEQLVPASFGLASVTEVIEAFHFGRLAPSAVNALVLPLFEAAAGGDSVANSVVDRQAEEIVLMACVAIERLGLGAQPVPVVLGGGVLAAEHPALMQGIAAGLAARAPLAHVELVRHPPILGAALLALEAAGATPVALLAAEAALTGKVRA